MLALHFAMVIVPGMVVLLAVIVVLVGPFPVVMVAVMIRVGLELDFAAHLLEVEVAIEVIFQPQQKQLQHSIFPHENYKMLRESFYYFLLFIKLVKLKLHHTESSFLNSCFIK